MKSAPKILKKLTFTNCFIKNQNMVHHLMPYKQLHHANGRDQWCSTRALSLEHSYLHLNPNNSTNNARARTRYTWPKNWRVPEYFATMNDFWLSFAEPRPSTRALVEAMYTMLKTFGTVFVVFCILTCLDWLWDKKIFVFLLPTATTITTIYCNYCNSISNYTNLR